MKHQLFSIHDTKAEHHFPPFAVKSFGEAERNFKDLAKDPQSNISKHPEDFHLYHVGEYELETGKITALDAPKHIAHAATLPQ